MVILEIGNSYSKITGLTPQQEKELQAELSYTVGGSSAYFSGYGIRKKYLLTKRGEFPTGLLGRVSNLLTNSKVIDKRHRPNRRANPTGAFAWDWQKQALIKTVDYDRGTITAPTGTGKSRTIQMICERFGIKTLIVVPTLQIKNQLREILFGLNNVTIENIDSTALNSLSDFDCLIIDEAHHVASKTYQRLNKTVWKDIYYRYFFTATPFRNDSEETLLFESIAGQVIYKLDYINAIRKGYIVPIEAYYVDLPKQKTDAYTYQEVYKELVVNNVIRHEYILKILRNLNTSNKSTLCLVREINHGDKLMEFPFVSGSDKNSRTFIKDFNNKTIDVLVGTTGILGEGVDTKPCEFVIIAGLGKAKSQFMQQVGRAVRKYPCKESAKVIIFRDPSHKYLLRHFKAQCRILLDEYGVKPIKLEI